MTRPAPITGLKRALLGAMIGCFWSGLATLMISRVVSPGNRVFATDYEAILDFGMHYLPMAFGTLLGAVIAILIPPKHKPDNDDKAPK